MTTTTQQRSFWRNGKTWHIATKVYNHTDCNLVIGHMRGPLSGPLYGKLEEHNLWNTKLCRKCFPNGSQDALASVPAVEKCPDCSPQCPCYRHFREMETETETAFQATLADVEPDANRFPTLAERLASSMLDDKRP